MLQYPYPIRLTPIWGKTMRQFSERFSSCRTQQEYTQVGIKIFRFFRMEGSNRFPDRRRIPTCEARHGNPIDFPMLQWELEEKPRPHYRGAACDCRHHHGHRPDRMVEQQQLHQRGDSGGQCDGEPEKAGTLTDLTNRIRHRKSPVGSPKRNADGGFFYWQMVTIRLHLCSKQLFGQNKWPINEKAHR